MTEVAKSRVSAFVAAGRCPARGRCSRVASCGLRRTRRRLPVHIVDARSASSARCALLGLPAGADCGRARRRPIMNR